VGSSGKEKHAVDAFVDGASSKWYLALWKNPHACVQKGVGPKLGQRPRSFLLEADLSGDEVWASAASSMLAARLVL